MKNIKKFERGIIFAFVFGIIVSSLLAFWGDFHQTIDQILNFDWRLAPLILLLTCFNYFLRFLRWHFFLGKVGFEKKIDPRSSGAVFLSGLPLTLTPGKTGEVLKAYFLKRIMGDHLSRTIPVVITERLTDGLGALMLLAFSFCFFSFGWLVPALALCACGLFIFLIYFDPFWVMVTDLLTVFGKKKPFFARICVKIGSFRDVLLKLIGWRNLLLATFLAALAWFSESLGFAIIFSTVGGISFSLGLLSKAVFIFCFVSILGFVSLLPGGLGVAEGGFTGMLVLLVGLSRPQAVASTILLRLLTLWWGVAIGIVAFVTALRHFTE